MSTPLARGMGKSGSPSGTEVEPCDKNEKPSVGYLFTDMDGSTGKWEKTPVEMMRAQARHDAIIDEIVAKNGGTVHDWAGDGAFAIFRGGDPLQCALDIQRALQAENWDSVGGLSIRIGVHCASDAPHGVDKVSINRAARIMASGWGGQIVVSEKAAGAYGAPPGCAFTDLGVCRFRGVNEPMRLFGLVHPALHRCAFPPPRNVLSRRRGIPVPTAPIHGRDRELAEIGDKLGGASRQLTIVGPGGNGKTRLAIEVAAKFPEETDVYFASLGGVGDAAELTPALGGALAFPFHGQTPPEEQLIDYLRDKQALIVLDNAERLAGKCVFLDKVLNRCAGVRILATSREPLGIDGESIFPLRGLEGPAGLDRNFRSAPACKLFVEEARKFDEAFAFKDDEGAIFGEICEMLGGSPLALRLAAQWAPLLSLEEIRAKLRDGLAFLTARESVFEGSWALLTEEQQAVLARLSVFEGGFDVQAAQRVALADLVTLGALLRKCLIERREQRRFVMHPLIHEYARDRLVRMPGDLFAETRRRHGAYFLDFVRQSFLAARGAEQGRMLDRIQTELGNLRAAWAYAVETKDIGRACEAAEPIFHACALRSLFRECASLFDVETEDEGLRRYSLGIRANCLIQQGEYRAGEDLARLALEGGACEAPTAAHCHQALANAAHGRGDLPAAVLLYRQALAECARTSNSMGSYYATMSLAVAELQLGNIESARDWVRESYRLCLAMGHLGGMLPVHSCAGDIAAREGRADDAQSSYRKAVEVGDGVGQPQLKAATLVKLGTISSERGDVEQALASFEEACELAVLVGDRRIEANARIGLGRNLRLAGELERARSELPRALAHARALSARPILARALVELAHVKLAAGDGAGAARVAGVLLCFESEAPEAERDALFDALKGRRPRPPENLDEALLELINERDFGDLGF